MDYKKENEHKHEHSHEEHHDHHEHDHREHEHHGHDHHEHKHDEHCSCGHEHHDHHEHDHHGHTHDEHCSCGHKEEKDCRMRGHDHHEHDLDHHKHDHHDHSHDEHHKHEHCSCGHDHHDHHEHKHDDHCTCGHDHHGHSHDEHHDHCTCGHDHHDHHGHDHSGCGCEHHHGSLKEMVVQFGISALFFVGGIFTRIFFAEAGIQIKNFYAAFSTVLFVIAWLIAGYKVLLTSVKNILKGQVFDENFLVELDLDKTISYRILPYSLNLRADQISKRGLPILSEGVDESILSRLNSISRGVSFELKDGWIYPKSSI